MTSGADVQAPATGLATDRPTLGDLLDLERIEDNLYRSCAVFREDTRLYGGQVAAQALCAAGDTVPDGRQPHSLHGYFLRAGSTTRPTVFQVDRDRDGSSFSARRVIAIQDGEVIFNMSASFALPREGIEQDVHRLRDLPDRGGLISTMHTAHVSIEARMAGDDRPPYRWPTRFWVRCAAFAPERPLLHTCAVAYVSDLSAGLLSVEGDAATTGASLDHAVWFHRQAKADDWLLVDLVPHVASGGRGWYTGAVYDPDGRRVASLAQEALFARNSTRKAK